MAVTMNPAALIFLRDERACRLAVAWQSCRGDVRTWARAAGFDDEGFRVTEMQSMLRVNNICRPGGVVDDLALQFIAKAATSWLENKSSGRKRSSP